METIPTETMGAQLDNNGGPGTQTNTTDNLSDSIPMDKLADTTKTIPNRAGSTDTVCGRIFQSFGTSRGYWINGLVVFRSEADARTLHIGVCDQIRRNYSGPFLFLGLHDDHLHIIHSCTYSTRSCRCNLYAGIDPLTLTIRKNEVKGTVISKTMLDITNAMVGKI